MSRPFGLNTSLQWNAGRQFDTHLVKLGLVEIDAGRFNLAWLQPAITFAHLKHYVK